MRESVGTWDIIVYDLVSALITLKFSGHKNTYLMFLASCIFMRSKAHITTGPMVKS